MYTTNTPSIETKIMRQTFADRKYFSPYSSMHQKWWQLWQKYYGFPVRFSRAQQWNKYILKCIAKGGNGDINTEHNDIVNKWSTYFYDPLESMQNRRQLSTCGFVFRAVESPAMGNSGTCPPGLPTISRLVHFW